MREGIRRRLALNHEYRDMMISGYIDPATLKSWPHVDDMAKTDIVWQDDLRRKHEKKRHLEEKVARMEQMSKMVKMMKTMNLLSKPSIADVDEDAGDSSGSSGETGSVSDGGGDE